MNNHSSSKHQGLSALPPDAFHKNADTTHPPTARRGVPVPRSDVTAAAFTHATSDGLVEIVVYHRSCAKRLFDIHPLAGGQVDRNASPNVLRLERLCQRCHRIMSVRVTAAPGYPHPDTPAGFWWCECGGPLARIDAVRGRVTVRCRCGEDARVTALDAVRAVEGHRHK